MKNCNHALYSVFLAIIFTNGFAQEIKPSFTIKHVNNILYVYFSPDEKHVVTISNDDPASIWETSTGKLIAAHLSKDLKVLKFSPDGKFVSFSYYEFDKIWELSTGKSVQNLKEEEVMDFSPNGKHIVTGAKDKTLKIREITADKIIWNLVGHTDHIRSAKFFQNGKYVVTSSYDGTVKIWDVETGKLKQNIAGHNAFVFYKFSPDGEYFITSSGSGGISNDGKNYKQFKSDGVVKIWETATGKLIGTLTNTYYADYAQIFSPDGKYIYNDAWQNVRIWETETVNLLHNYITGWVGSFNPAEKLVLTYSEQNKALKIWETVTGKLIRDYKGYSGGSNIVFDQSGALAISADWDDAIQIWETVTGKLLHDIPAGSYVDFSPDKKYFITTADKESHSDRSYPKIFETATGKLIKDLPENTYVWRTVFSPKGKYIVTQSIDTSLNVQKTIIWNFSAVPKPTAPANLEIKAISFSDKKGNQNNILDANEKTEIGFTLLNSGKGNAYNLVAEIKSLNSVNGVEYSKQNPISNLASGESTIVSIPISAAMNVESGTANFEIQIKEGNGFDSDPVRVSFNVQKFKTPQVTIADYKFSTDGGKIKLGQLIALEIVLQNKGQGEASNIKVSFNNPSNVFPASETNFAIDKLRPNENQKFVYEFFANKMFSAKEIPIEVSVTESYNQYGDKRTLNVSLEQTLSQIQTVAIAGQVEKPFQIENVSLRSEVDTNIPVTDKIYKNRYALVIGNEDYKKYQTGLKSDQNVLFARNDATVFKEYLTKTMGVPEKQTFMLTDATRAQMNRELERVTELAKLTPNSELIFYYAGHGLPDIETRQGYLIPVDVTASNLKDAISLKDLYSKLASSKATKVLVFLDACFSGGGRGENGLLAARTVKVKPKGDIVEGNIVAFTATSGEEVSLPLTKEYHGLFTYHVLRKLKDTQGELTLEQLKDYLESEIPKTSLIENGIKQTPQVLTAPDLNDKWLSWKIQN